jgi:hypothetical protein
MRPWATMRSSPPHRVLIVNAMSQVFFNYPNEPGQDPEGLNRM